MDYKHIVHPFEAIFNAESEILILGSLPSVKSRENNFYYGHPQNRFWRVLALIFGEDTPNSISEKKCFLLKHKIALWDVIYSCDISGSSDSSINNLAASSEVCWFVKGIAVGFNTLYTTQASGY